MRRGLRKDDIEFLKMELRSIHAGLRLLGSVAPEQLPQHLKQWADRSREVSYDIQDILDTFLVRVEEAHPDSSKGLVNKMARHFLRYHRTRREIADAILDVKILVHEIAERRSRYQADTIAATANPAADTIAATANPAASSVDPRLLDLMKDEKRLVGIDQAMKDVIGMLGMDDTDDTSNHELKTVCIIGVGGLGKTTLARAVFHKLQPQFDSSAFVSLSLNPNINKVLSSILQQLDNGKDTSEATGEWDEERLVYHLRQLLQDKRYLIAVDDIWDIKSWEEVRGLMVDNVLGSRIITTTRKQDVAEQVGDRYYLKPLSIDDSKHLFYGTIFVSERKYYDDNQFDGLVDKIVKRCCGVPLALITIARLLGRRHREEWNEVLNRFFDEPGDVSDQVNIRKALLLSYYELPSYLKPCFLYLSMFPEDYLIRRDRLVWRWVAEGLIQGKQGCSLFQIGQKYFEELLDRSFIMDVDKDDVSDGMTHYCRVHELLLDLSCSLASDENFVTKLVKQEEHIFSEHKVRRLSLQNSQIGRRAHTLKVGRHVRSVAAFDTGIKLMPPLLSFHILRVLDLEGCDLTGSYFNHAHLGKLLHLRYLGLRGTNVSQLPKDIGNLRLLQLLDLKGTRVRELPLTFALLHKLLCLYVEPETRVPKGTGNLTSLEELTKVSVSESPSFMKELKSLVELRVLDIVLMQGMSQSSEKDLVESLCNLHKLQSLRINGHHSKLDFMTTEGGWKPPPGFQRFIAEDGWFSVLPTWISSADSLLQLQIGVGELWREGLQSLGMLRELRFLCLAVERMGERLAVDAYAFPNLTQLRLDADTCLVFRPRALPKLQLLKFVLDVDKAKGDFNWDLSNLRSLEKVTVKLLVGNSASANKEAEAALRHALESHPNRPKLEITMVTVTAHQEQEQMESVDNVPQNVASSSEIQEERSA